MSRVFTVDGKRYELKAWTGGDVPTVFETGKAFIAVRGQLYREQWHDFVTYWYEAPGPDVRKVFWSRASSDAWRTVTWTSMGPQLKAFRLIDEDSHA